jgi:hypothetical protein
LSQLFPVCGELAYDFNNNANDNDNENDNANTNDDANDIVESLNQSGSRAIERVQLMSADDVEQREPRSLVALLVEWYAFHI